MMIYDFQGVQWVAHAYVFSSDLQLFDVMNCFQTEGIFDQ